MEHFSVLDGIFDMDEWIGRSYVVEFRWSLLLKIGIFR